MKYFFLLPYYNLHVGAMLDELSKIPDSDVCIGILHPGASFRPGYDWDQLINDEISIKFFSEPTDIDKAFLSKFDVVGTLGIFGESRLYRTTLVAAHMGKQIAILSEGIRPQGQLRRLRKRIIIWSLNRRNVSLFAIGSGSYQDYFQLGATRWSAYSFGFSVPSTQVRNIPIERNVEQEKGPLRIVYAGQLIERKRVTDLIAACERLSSEGVNLTLDLFGSGELDSEIRAMAAAGPMAKLTTFHGLTAYDDLVSKLPTFDVLALCSGYDGWGAVVNEAMAAGLAVIVSDQVRAKQIVVDGTNGHHYPVGDINALADKIGLLAERKEALNAFKLASRDIIHDYTPSELSSRLHQIMASKVKGLKAVKFQTSLKQLSL